MVFVSKYKHSAYGPKHLFMGCGILPKSEGLVAVHLCRYLDPHYAESVSH